MELNFLKKKLIKIKKSNQKVYILGRGFSTSIFLKNLKKNKKNNLIIGFNTHEIINELDFYFTNKKKISFKFSKKKLFEVKKIIKFLKKEIKVYKIGSIIYSIDPILHFIDKLVEKSSIENPLKIIFVGFDFRTSLPDGDYKTKSNNNRMKEIEKADKFADNNYDINAELDKVA